MSAIWADPRHGGEVARRWRVGPFKLDGDVSREGLLTRSFLYLASSLLGWVMPGKLGMVKYVLQIVMVHCQIYNMWRLSLLSSARASRSVG
jgi:hypothetical protein